jgi:hypothetical protein
MNSFLARKYIQSYVTGLSFGRVQSLMNSGENDTKICNHLSSHILLKGQTSIMQSLLPPLQTGLKKCIAFHLLQWVFVMQDPQSLDTESDKSVKPSLIQLLCKITYEPNWLRLTKEEKKQQCTSMHTSLAIRLRRSFRVISKRCMANLQNGRLITHMDQSISPTSSRCQQL